MNNQPAQHLSHDNPLTDAQSTCPCHDLIDCPDQATVPIAATQLAHIAELLDLLDGFLRTGNGVAHSLRDYLHTTKAEHPERAGYDTNLVIDLVSFTAHTLRTHHLRRLQ